MSAAHSRTNTTTHFFREARALALLHRQLGPRPSVWCAGCSTGDEAYSMVIAALAAGGSIEVTASDINPVALATAERGEYPERNLRHVPAEVRERWFVPIAGRRYRVCDEVRERVRFVRCDLTRDDAPGRGFAAVFCRNVMVYFHRGQATRAVTTMAGALAPGGLLVIGASEWLPVEVRVGAPELVLEELEGVMVYRRQDLARPPVAPRPAPMAMAMAAAPMTEPEPAPVPPSLPPPAPLAADDFIDKLRQAGDGLLDAGSAREARACYQAALAREPLLPDLHLRVAMTHLHDTDVPATVARIAAHDALRQSLFLAPELWPAWILLAEVTEPVDPQAAVLALERARVLLVQPVALPQALASFVGDARAARDAVARRLSGRRRHGT